MKTKGQMEFEAALAANADRWVPACGGTETEYNHPTYGCRVLYCWNPRQNRHAYINLDTDMVIERTPAPAPSDVFCSTPANAIDPWQHFIDEAL